MESAHIQGPRKRDLNAASAGVEIQSEGGNIPPSNPRVGCRANEGTATPLRRQAAIVRKETKVSMFIVVSVVTGLFRTSAGRDAPGCDATY